MRMLSREDALIATAFVWAERSTCSRLHVGAVVHRDGRPLTVGYNGAPSGLPHCNHDCTCFGDYPYLHEETNETRHRYGCPAPEPCTTAVHAEANAIAFAARHGVELNGADIVVTNQPCYTCATLIVNAGLRSVVYVLPYRAGEAGLRLLDKAGIDTREVVFDTSMFSVVGLTGA